KCGVPDSCSERRIYAAAKNFVVRPRGNLEFEFWRESYLLCCRTKQLVANDFENELAALKEKLLLMASHAEAAVNRAVKALLKRDDDLARRTEEDDRILDRLEIEIDDCAIKLLEQGPATFDLRLITMAMKISH